MSRGTEVHTIAPAATKMSAPSMPLEKYSAFSWPKLCSWSGFSDAYVSTASAMSAARMLTTDSTASESRPTEPVRKYAANLSAMTTTEVATETHA